MMFSFKNKEDNQFFQFIKFCVVGASNTLVYLGVYYALLYVNVHYLIANLVGFVISVFNAYYWNKKFVFKVDTAPKGKTIFKTYVSYGVTTCISSALIYWLVETLGVSKNTAPIITLLATIPLNFILNKFWTFK